MKALIPGRTALDSRLGAAYVRNRRSPMAKPDLEERKILFLEAIAASAIFAIFAVVLYMVFSYKPG